MEGQWFKRLLRTVVTMAFPVLLGFCIIWADRVYWMAATDREKVVPDSIKDIAIVIVGVSVVEVVWAILGGAPTEGKLDRLLKDLQATRSGIYQDVASMSALTRHSDRLGIVDFGLTESELPYPQNQFIADVHNARTGIDLCGSTLNYVYKNDGLISALVEATNRNVPVRVLLPSPSSGVVVAIFKNDYKMQIEVAVKDLTNALKIRGPKIQVKHLESKALPLCLLRVDETMLVMPYMFAYQTAESPRFLLRGQTPLSAKYQFEFDQLFLAAVPAV